MAVFRADNKDEEEVQPADDPEEIQLEEPLEGEATEPSIIEGSVVETPDLETDSEQDSLNDQQDRFDAPHLSRQDSVAPMVDERTRLNRFNRANRQEADNSSRVNKKLAAGVSLFILPTAVGLILLLLALQAGFALEHIRRVTSGLRFGSLHLALSKRFNHLRREYIRVGHLETDPNSNLISRYTRTTIGQRLLGVTPDKILTNLKQRGYVPKFTIVEGGSRFTLGRKTLTQVKYPDGTVKEINNSAEARAFLTDVRQTFEENNFSRFKAVRASLFLAKQIGIPFLRFNAIIDSVRDGSVRHITRGSPQDFVRERIDDEILEVKDRVANKSGRLKDNLRRFDLDEIADEANERITLRQAGVAHLTAFLESSLDGRQRVFSIAAAGSIAVSVITLACVVRELGVMLKNAFQMKVRGLQDSAATLTTTTSQIKDGHITGEIVSDMTQRFNGFATSANYQLTTNKPGALATVGHPETDFSETYNLNDVFGGFKVKGLSTVSSWLSPAAMSNNFQAYVGQYAQQSAGFFGKIFNAILSFMGRGVELTAGFLETAFAKTCEAALKDVVQIGILVVEILATILVAVFSAGLGLGARIGAGQMTKEVIKRIGYSFLVGAAGGIALDMLLFDYLLPGVVKSATGLDSALLFDPDNQASGAENYARVDYGMHYLKEAEALNMGGSRMPVSEGFLQAQAFLAWEKQQYQEQGLLNNIFDLDNPYSLGSNLAVIHHTGETWPQKTSRYAGNLLANLKTSLDISQPVYAQEISSATIQAVLYPGQNSVIGFSESEMLGQRTNFDHLNNTLYVEDHLDTLYREYSPCLGIDASDFLMADLGISQNTHGRDHYPAACDSEEARRYKLYYQDCLLIDGLERWGTNSSPMFSSRCDHLLPQTVQEILGSPSDQAGLAPPALMNNPTPNSQPPNPTNPAALEAVNQQPFNLLGPSLRRAF